MTLNDIWSLTYISETGEIYENHLPLLLLIMDVEATFAHNWN